MQTEKIISLKQKNTGLVIFTALCISALLGVLFGSLSYCFVSGETADRIYQLQTEYIQLRKSLNILRILLDSLMNTGLFVFIAYLLGYSAISQPLLFLIPFARGVGFGVMLSQLYGSDFSPSALLKSTGFIVCVFLSLVIIILSSREAVYISNRLFKACFQDRLLDGMKEHIKAYSVKILLLFASVSVVSAADCIFSVLLLR